MKSRFLGLTFLLWWTYINRWMEEFPYSYQQGWKCSRLWTFWQPKWHTWATSVGFLSWTDLGTNWFVILLSLCVFYIWYINLIGSCLLSLDPVFYIRTSFYLNLWTTKFFASFLFHSCLRNHTLSYFGLMPLITQVA